MNFHGYCPVLTKDGDGKLCTKDGCAWYSKNVCVVFSILSELEDIASNTSYISSGDCSSDVSKILRILKNQK